MEYISVITDYGRQAISAALAGGTTVNIVKMVYGDANGTPYTPTSDMTQLVNQVGQITVLTKTSDNDWAYFTGTIPATQSAFTLREVGLYDDNNRLVAIANTPDAYKPTSLDGVILSLPVSVAISIQSGSVIVVEATDESYATKEYVQDSIGNIVAIDCGTF